MQTKRLYDRERRLIIALIMGAAFIILTGVLVIARVERDLFKDSLINKNYEKLYTYIENPDFSYNIFNAYMVYNYGGDIDIINTEKSGNQIIYTIATDTGEKSITLEKRNGKDFWIFNDYVYDWNINIPKNAKITIENMGFENKEGEVAISKLPFAVYQMNITAENCKDYNERVLSGQKLAIKLDIAPSSLRVIEEVIKEYLNFKQNAINSGVINNINVVEKESGIYKEVVEEAEWLRNADYEMSKEMSNLIIEECMVDFDGTICVTAVEVWDTTIINENGENFTTDKYRNIYYLNPEDNFKITKIKNEQV